MSEVANAQIKASVARNKEAHMPKQVWRKYQAERVMVTAH